LVTCHIHEKKHTPHTHIACILFCFFGHISYHHIVTWVFDASGLRVSVSSVIVAATVVGITCIAHETVLDADEIGAVIKAGIAVAAEAVFVQVMLL